MSYNWLGKINRKSLLLVTALLVIAILRISFVGVMGLMPQDAYYSFYGDHPALSYYDHPPAIAYQLLFFTTLFGKKVAVLKLADTVVTLLTLFSFYKLSTLFLSLHKVKRALLLVFTTLMITITSLVSTPDTPLLLFWTLSLLFLYHAIFLEKKVYWIAAGLTMGLSFDSKYTGIFLPMGLVLFLLLSPPHRKWLFSIWFWICNFLWLVMISPVIIWNAQNHWASLRFQSIDRMTEGSSFQFSASNFFGLIGHQSALLMPILFFALLFFVFRTIKRKVVHDHVLPPKHLFLLCFFLPVFFFFIILSPFYWVKLNWMMPSYISAIVWISIYLRGRWIRYQVLTSLLIHVVLAIEIIDYPVLIKSDDTWIGWKAFSNRVRQVREAHPNDFIFSADDYKTSAVLNFYLDEMVYSRNIIGQNGLQFEFVNANLERLSGKNALYIDSDPKNLTVSATGGLSNLPPDFFDRITPVEQIFIKKNGRIVRKFNIYECENYHPPKKEYAVAATHSYNWPISNFVDKCFYDPEFRFSHYPFKHILPFSDERLPTAFAATVQSNGNYQHQ